MCNSCCCTCDYKISYPSKERFTYYVNKEKRTIVCKFDRSNGGLYKIAALSCIGKLKKHLSSKNIPCNGLFSMVEGFFKKNVKETYVGKATCSENDEWNEGYGKDLARDRALVNYYCDVRRAVVEMEMLFSNFFNLSVDRYKSVHDSINRIQTRIDEALGIVYEDNDDE